MYDNEVLIKFYMCGCKGRILCLADRKFGVFPLAVSVQICFVLAP